MRVWNYGLGLLVFAIVVAAVMLRSGREPSYHGKTLSEWMRGHPRDYRPAIQAMGTNAIAFLLSELQVKDSVFSRAAQEVFRKCLDSTVPWETSRTRRYHARLALQILDTNAVPALVHALFQEPFRLKEGHITWEAANAFNWLASPEARQQVAEVLSQALRNPNMQKRRSACLAFATGFRGSESDLKKLVECTRDPEPLVRAAAIRAFNMWQTNHLEVIQALIERLDDSQAGVRRLAVEALGHLKGNAIAALPALQAAYTNEVTRQSLADDVDDTYRGRAITPEQNQWTIGQALRAIAPGTALPGGKR